MNKYGAKSISNTQYGTEYLHILLMKGKITHEEYGNLVNKAEG